MLDLSPDTFSEEFRSLPATPAQPWYRLPDGEHVRIAYPRVEGTVVTTTGRWVTADEMARAQQLT